MNNKQPAWPKAWLTLILIIHYACAVYVIDDSVGLGRMFDGVGGLSGGGATSRLLVSYPEPQRSHILDYLFLPKFGASLHILKVEIGGDAQSTDGTESSHMHTADDENYQRGYEWWLMVEAKKRNPNIKLYGLSWAYPAWVGNGTGSPYKYPNLTATYICKWIKGAKDHYNLTIDYVGIWNERQYDINYIKILRKTLDSSGLTATEIVAADKKFNIATDILSDKELADAVSIIGAHYPGTESTSDAMKTGKPVWASEDYSTYNDEVGTGCWARILNENYVHGNMTSTISWNLIASYYYGLPYYRDGLMTAIEPWSGSYNVTGTIWASAHTTQFVQPGYYYLKHGFGSGKLDHGGSYVTFVNKEKPSDFTIVIETMTHNHSKCIRPFLLPYTVAEQDAEFVLKGSFASTTSLKAWYSKPGYNGKESDFFLNIDSVPIKGGNFTAHLIPDTILTLTTSTGQTKGSYSVPPSKPFPIPYKDDFESYEEYSEANYFADQTGVWEIREDSEGVKGKIMEQVVTQRPITWCDDANQPVSIIGNANWKSVNASIDAMLLDDGGLFLAALVNRGGCGVRHATGVFFWIFSGKYQQWVITRDLTGSDVISQGSITINTNQWYTLGLNVQKKSATIHLDGKELATVRVSDKAGFVGIGTSSFIHAAFDNIEISNVSYRRYQSDTAG